MVIFKQNCTSFWERSPLESLLALLPVDLTAEIHPQTDRWAWQVYYYYYLLLQLYARYTKTTHSYTADK